jgi:hypothetical protein
LRRRRSAGSRMGRACRGPPIRYQFFLSTSAHRAVRGMKRG